MYLTILIVGIIWILYFAYRGLDRPFIGERRGDWQIVDMHEDHVELRKLDNTVSVFVSKSRLTMTGFK